MNTSLKTNLDFNHYLSARQTRINDFIQTTLPHQDLEPTHLHQAMRYSVLNGGKRIRPLLVYATGELFGLDLALLDYPACALELIHAYSLVHDDLPAMDDDDLRRGMPTCHKAFDEATAILVGDGLQSLAFQVLADNPTDLSAQQKLEMIACLAKASSSLGMVGGQALDLKATGQVLSSDQLAKIHELKTGALITAAIKLGMIAADIRDTTALTALTTFASHIGLCFQIQDDILNQVGDPSLLGKNTGTDAAKKKVTFSTIKSVAYATESLQFFYQKALSLLHQFGKQADTLKFLAEYMILRDH